MIAKNITSRLAREFRRFRATAIGEFAVALVLFTVIGSLFVALLFTACPNPALAVDATWVGNFSSNWNTGANWSPTNAPVNPGDTAAFGISTTTTPTISANTNTVESITFRRNASAFSIQVGIPAQGTNAPVPGSLILQGVGIINNSRNVQTINNFGTTSFSDTSRAVNATINNFGTASFSDTSRAGNATIDNFGTTSFFDTSRAGIATIDNFGTMSFFGTSRAGNATITNSGDSSFTAFTQGATGGNAALVNANPTAFITIAELDGAGTTVGSIAGNGTIFLGSKNLTVGGNQQSTVFSGVIRDGESPNLPSSLLTAQPSYIGGSLSKIGTGTLTLAGENAYTGATTVNGGSLIVDGSIASADTLVNPGGLLGGHGFIGGNLVSSEVVSPGSPALTVKGDYTQNPSGALRIEVAGTGPSQHSLLAVNGRASLAGTLQLIRVGGFNLSPGDQVTFLTANKGVSGTFGTVQNDFVATGTVVKGEVVYLPDAVLLRATQGSFADPGIVGSTPIFVAVGNALDSAAGDPRAAALIGFLNNLPLSELPGAIAQIVPEEVTAVDAVGVSTANVQSTNLAQRMGEIHAGSSGFSSSGFSISGSGPSFSDGFAGVNGPAGKSGESVFAPIPDNRWGVFITGIGEFTNVSSTFEAPGYDLATGGFTLGVDYRVLPNFAIGLTGGYAYTGISLADNGHIRVNGGKLGIYSTVFGSGFYLDTAVTGGLNGYKTRRTALEGTANGSTEGGELNVGVAVGYDWKKGGLSIGPTASFQYTLVGFNGFTESGSLAPLEYHDQTTESFRTAFGMKASYDWKVGPIRLIPQVRAAWQHEYGATDYSIVASFASGAGDSFTVNGPQIGRDSLLVGAGFAIQWNESITTYAYYDGEFFRTNYLSNNVSAGVRVGF